MGQGLDGLGRPRRGGQRERRGGRLDQQQEDHDLDEDEGAHAHMAVCTSRRRRGRRPARDRRAWRLRRGRRHR
jgi:hypothetical protein